MNDHFFADKSFTNSSAIELNPTTRTLRGSWRVCIANGKTMMRALARTSGIAVPIKHIMP